MQKYGKIILAVITAVTAVFAFSHTDAVMGMSIDTVICFNEMPPQNTVYKMIADAVFAYDIVNEDADEKMSLAQREEYEEIIDFEIPGIDIIEKTTKAQESVTETATEPEKEEVVQSIVPVSGSILEAASKLYPIENLYDYNFALKNFFVVPKVTTLRKEVLDLKKINSIDLTIEKDSEKPQILIFHTHSQESFADYEANHKTIVDAGTYLTNLLRGYGYNVIHLTDSFDMVSGKLDRGRAYNYANEKVSAVLKEYPSIQVVIDLHRDGVPEGKRLVTEINNKKTAQIMLFNGISYSNEVGDIEYLYNPYITENLAMTYKMCLLSKVLYPDYVRCIYIQSYRYCLHHRARSMLIEAGAQTNTYEEVYNAMEPLAVMLDRLLRSS